MILKHRLRSILARGSGLAATLTLVLVLPVTLSLALGQPRSARAEPPKTTAAETKPTDITTIPPFEEFLVVPLRVHVLQAADLPDVDCKLTDEDLKRILGKMNGIWHKAGVHFAVESIRRETAEGQDRFRLATQLDGDPNAKPDTPKSNTKATEKPRSNRQPGLGLYRVLTPAATRSKEGVDVYYVHELPVNGVYLGNRMAFVKETAGLRAVEGGIDEPIPRVTAHELGHALGLNHRQDRTNLLASGTTGILLNSEEAQIARATALKLPGGTTVKSLQEQAERAEKNSERDEARRAWAILAEIPGAGDQAREAIQRLKKSADPVRP